MQIVPSTWELDRSSTRGGLAHHPPLSPPPGQPCPIGPDQGGLARSYSCMNSCTRPLVSYNSLKVYNSMAYFIFRVYNYHHCLISEHCLHTKNNFTLIRSPQLQQTTDLLSVSIALPLLDFAYKWNQILWGLWVSFTQHYAFKVHPCYSMHQYFILYDCGVIFPYLAVHFVYSSIDRHLGCIHSPIDRHLGCYYE